MPVAMRCQINIRKAKFSKHNAKLDCIRKFGRYLQLRRFNFFCTAESLLSLDNGNWQLVVPKWWFLRSCLCCRDVGPNGPNNKHSLEEHLWHVGSTTSTVAPLRVARLGWLPSQAKLPLHDGWHWARKLCQWPWDVKSTIGKAKLPQHKPGSPWENWSLPTTSQLYPE